MTHESDSSQPELKPRILVVDDEAPVRELLQTFLVQKGFAVVTAGTGAEALQIARETTIHLTLVDFVLSDCDGLDLVARLLAIKSRRPVIVMTGFGFDEQLLREAFEKGAVDCVSKTSPLDELLARINRALADSDGGPAVQIGTAVKPLQPTAGGLDVGYLSAVPIPLAISLLTARHPNLGNTALRAVALAEAVGKQLALSETDSRALSCAAAWHDIALISWDSPLIERWLSAPNRCTVEDWKIIKRHPDESDEILRLNSERTAWGEIIRCHHENWDGSGFPRGLKRDSIPLLARLLTVMVAFCSQLFPKKHVFVEIRKSAGKQFDPNAIDVIATAAASMALPLGKRLVAMDELRPGMILGEDISNNEATVILSKDQELTSAWINKILSIHAATPIRSQVLICC